MCSWSAQRRGRRSKGVFKEIMAEIFPNWMEIINLHIPKVQRMPRKET